jgi:hypothetical protein
MGGGGQRICTYEKVLVLDKAYASCNCIYHASSFPSRNFLIQLLPDSSILLGFLVVLPSYLSSRHCTVPDLYMKIVTM